MKNRLSEEQGRCLLGLVRETIGRRLGISFISEELSPQRLEDHDLQQPGATFVTLKYQGNLRGCIGNLEASGSLVESIRRNSMSAAFDDHRFSPLTTGEFSSVQFEISILSPPEQLEYRDCAELLETLRPGIDGVILQIGKARATFLPQVWEQLPEPVDFLNHLCQKAGLSPAAWQHKQPDIFLYQVQSFKEERT